MVFFSLFLLSFFFVYFVIFFSSRRSICYYRSVVAKDYIIGLRSCDETQTTVAVTAPPIKMIFIALIVSTWSIIAPIICSVINTRVVEIRLLGELIDEIIGKLFAYRSCNGVYATKTKWTVPDAECWRICQRSSVRMRIYQCLVTIFGKICTESHTYKFVFNTKFSKSVIKVIGMS